MSRVAVVTGASEGIGYGIAEGLLQEGYRVALVGRRAQVLRSAATQLDPEGTSTLQLVADVSKECGGQLVVSRTLDHFGRLDVLCLNAGIYPGAVLSEVTEEHVQSMFQTNVFGQLYLIRAASEALIASENGRIVLTSSITGPLTGMAGYAAYGASKAAQLGLMKNLAVELAPYGITVNAVLPGKIEVGRTHLQDPAYVAEALRAIPIGRLGTPADIARAVSFFASPKASFVTGQALVLDGGQTLPEVLTSGSQRFSVKGEHL